MKIARFVGDSLEAIRAFPLAVRKEAGYQIGRVQNGDDPGDWKALNIVGPGVNEIRIRDATGAYRVIYVAKFADAVFVLHAFQKKTQATANREIALATKRYKEITRL